MRIFPSSSPVAYSDKSGAMSNDVIWGSCAASEESDVDVTNYTRLTGGFASPNT